MQPRRRLAAPILAPACPISFLRPRGRTVSFRAPFSLRPRLLASGRRLGGSVLTGERRTDMAKVIREDAFEGACRAHEHRLVGRPPAFEVPRLGEHQGRLAAGLGRHHFDEEAGKIGLVDGSIPGSVVFDELRDALRREPAAPQAGRAEAEAAHLRPVRPQPLEMAVVELGVAPELLFAVETERTEEKEELRELIRGLLAELRGEVRIPDCGPLDEGVLKGGPSFMKRLAGTYVSHRLRVVRGRFRRRRGKRLRPSRGRGHPSFPIARSNHNIPPDWRLTIEREVCRRGRGLPDAHSGLLPLPDLG